MAKLSWTPWHKVVRQAGDGKSLPSEELAREMNAILRRIDEDLELR